MNPPSVLSGTMRKLGDSNPRYGYPYGSLANYWFQPLTQTSKLAAGIVLPKHHSQIASAKVSVFSFTSKLFHVYFSIRLCILLKKAQRKTMFLQMMQALGGRASPPDNNKQTRMPRTPAVLSGGDARPPTTSFLLFSEGGVSPQRGCLRRASRQGCRA